ncbi:MAG TPA: response regulator transcription factor [Candidatus Acidoferrales bacterium]|nr:response regulator transcription factor [Candidatus Acidoferrales bacterium]
MKRVRVLLVDDHTVVRRGLRRILESVPDIEVVGEVGDGAAAVGAASSLSPDVVIIDLSLPGLNGIQATKRIVNEQPAVNVLMLSMHAEEQYVEQSLAAGAKGYLVKDADDNDVVGAVLTVASGSDELVHPGAGRSTCPASVSPSVLSPRERQILTMICTGRTNREMASELRLSPNTIETHRKHLIEKLDLHSTAELVRYAIRHGMTG